MYSVSQLIASTNAGFLWRENSNTMVVGFMDNHDIEALLMQFRTDYAPSDKSLSLHFENLRGTDPLPILDVYLNLEQENTPEENNLIGSMALYGLAESSIESSENENAGQHRVFDVGQVFGRVSSQANWSKNQFKLTLMPAQSLANNATLTIGRVDLCFYKS